MAKRLAFKIPEYAPRTTWASAQAREVWEPRLQRISQTWLDVERMQVAEGLRSSALQNVSPEQLPALIKDIAENGLVVLPLSQTARAAGYQSAATQITGAWDYRCAITSQDKTTDWIQAWNKNDNEAIGKLLAYPQCCREFFERVWVKERWFDTTWPMVQDIGKDVVEVKPGVNILWRWHGVRSMSHLPCSFNCWHSKMQSAASLDLMSLKYPEEAAWLKEVANWPVEWSALHGIAEIRTPITRTSVATDATADKLVVRYMGEGYPEEGANGLTFPHKQATAKPLALKWSNSMDNGFSSHVAMQAAHGRLLEALRMPYKTVLDLGCGDGVLLSKIACNRRVGVEIDPRVAKLAEKRIDRVVVGDCTSESLLSNLIQQEQPDLIIAQYERNAVNRVANLMGRYHQPCKILSYSYTDNYTKVFDCGYFHNDHVIHGDVT